MSAAKEQIYNVVDQLCLPNPRNFRLYHPGEMRLFCGCRIQISHYAPVCNYSAFPTRTQRYIKDMGVPEMTHSQISGGTGLFPAVRQVAARRWVVSASHECRDLSGRRFAAAGYRDYRGIGENCYSSSSVNLANVVLPLAMPTRPMPPRDFCSHAALA
jgi:hypothetical protein